MWNRCCVGLLFSLLAHGPVVAQPAEAELVKAGGLEFVFATPEQAASVLGSRDTFVQQMSPFDRKVRMQTADDEGEEAFLKFASGEARSWPVEQREAVTVALKALDRPLKEIKLPEVGPILLIHTSGREESGAAYTRDKAIVLPAAQTGSTSRPRTKLLAHELFHILSRNDTKLRDKLYAQLGFHPSGMISLPGELSDLKLTNPDAPSIEHVMQVKISEGKTITITPVLFASRPYEKGGNPSLFSYLSFRLMEVVRSDDGDMIAKMENGKPVMHEPSIPDFHRQIGNNTRYIFHPEEILADNFAIWVTGDGQVNDPWVIDGMKKVFGSMSQ